MLRLVGSALALACVFSATALARSPDERLDGAKKAHEAGLCAEAESALRPWVRGSEFSALSADRQKAAWALLYDCAITEKRWPDAHASAKAVTALPGASPFFWRVRVAFGYWQQEPADAVTAAEVLAIRHLDQWKHIEDDVVEGLARDVRADTALALRYFAALDRAEWRPKNPFGSADWIWADYARLAHANGDEKVARRMADRVEQPRELLELALMQPFAADAAARPEAYDVRRAAESALVAAQRTAALHPDRLRGVVRVADALASLGRHADALAALEAAEARIETANTASAVFTDAEEYVPWLRNELAYALARLGRADEAVAALRRAAHAQEGGRPNVSQVINLAEMLTSVGRPSEALDTLADFETERKASPYGDMWMWSGRACANAALGRTAERDRALAFTREHRKDNPAAHTRALLCADDLDGAAAQNVERLADDGTRSEALVALSRFRPPPHVYPEQARMQARLDAVRARPEVRAAIAAAGRIADVPLHVTYWGDV